jgi:palmitoyltransferase
MATEKQNNESSEFIENEEDELFDYIHNLDEANIKELLSKKILPIWDYKSKENQNSSVLNISVYKKSFKITKIFIDYCKKHNSEKLKDFINEPNDQGVTPLHYASFRGEVQIIKLLVENGGDITKTTKRKLNVIHYCAQGNKPNSLLYFYLKMKENENERNQFKLIRDKDGGGSTPLHWAVYSIAEDLLLYLINLDIFEGEEDRKKFINQLDNEGYSALHLCVSSKSSRIAMKLLQNGADPKVVDKKGETPLQLAISKQQKDIIHILRNSQECQFCNVKAPVKQIKKSSKNIICVFSFQIIATFILLCSVLPIFLYKYNNKYWKLLYYSYIFLLFLFFLLYFMLLIINPGVKMKNNLNELKDLLLNKNADLTKFCYKCFIKKTRTSKHCIICDNCYDKFDHHCYWINKCVAKRNYKIFIFFLFEAAIYLIIILVITGLSLFKINFLKNNSFDKSKLCKQYNKLNLGFLENICEKVFDNKYILHLILNILLILIILSFLIPEFLLLILHIRVICTNYREERNRRATSFSTASLINEDDSSILVSNSTSKI